MSPSMQDSLKSYERYPWYDTVEGDELEQGDVFDACSVFAIDLPLSYEEFCSANYEGHIRAVERDVIIMTQSCDLVKEYSKVNEVLLCPIWDLEKFSEKNEYVRQTKGREEIRQGKHPGFHLLNNCHLPNFERPIRLVDFHRVFSLPLDFLRNLARTGGLRLRLLPPYREHLGQAFARYFMRVGLPVDIPPFKK